MKMNNMKMNNTQKHFTALVVKERSSLLSDPHNRLNVRTHQGCGTRVPDSDSDSDLRINARG